MKLEGGGNVGCAVIMLQQPCPLLYSCSHTHPQTNIRTHVSARPHTQALGTVGFTRGRAAWEFTAELDNLRDECLCYGAGVKPVESSAYDQSASLWTVRGYNGRCA